MSNETSSVYTMREINLELCTFTKPHKFDGYHESFININGDKGFVLQSPKLILRNSTSSYFEFLISRNKDRHKEFYNILSHLEDSAILQSSQNSGDWFGREIKRDQVETMFRSCIHRPLEINDPYILRISKTGNLDVEINYPVVCLIKFDGIIFGKNTSTLDMKIIQIKVIKTEKIPSEDDYLDQQNIQNEKPFYNDNASVIQHSFTDKRPTPIITEEKKVENESIIEKIDELGENQIDEIVNAEKLIEKITDEMVEPPSPVKSVKTIKSTTTQPVFLPIQHDTPVSVDSIKCDIMKAMADNDFQRVKELSILLQKHKLGTV